MPSRISILCYAALSYVLFLGVFLYAVGFVGGFLTPTALDGPAVDPPGVALLVDLGLLAAFAVQHSGMARPAFKRGLTRFVPRPAERATYVLLSNLALILLFWQWRPLPGALWSLSGAWAWPLGALCGAGWLAVLLTTFLLDHFELFGLRQAWLHFRGRPHAEPTFRTPGPYRYVRHPLYVGWMIAFWFTPTMTAAHLLFAAGTTGYMLVAVVLEERDLAASHPEYAAYRRRVPMLFPRLRAGRPAPADLGRLHVTDGA